MLYKCERFSDILWIFHIEHKHGIYSSTAFKNSEVVNNSVPSSMTVKVLDSVKFDKFGQKM